MKPKTRCSIIILSVLAAISLVTFFLNMRTKTASPPTIETTAHTTQATTAVNDIWEALLEATPVAYFTPLPDLVSSPIDGAYAKIDPSWPQWWLCRRCADYRLAGGIWKLHFDQGVMRIYYEVTGWRSLASFTVSGDRLLIFNDPYCPEAVGEYAWRLEGGNLTLEVVDDPCSFQLRGKNLGDQPWGSCRLHDQVEGEDGDRQASPSCEADPFVPPLTSPADLPITVVVYEGDSRFFEQPADIFAPANSIPTEGVQITYSAESISYGLNRVLWWRGNWIQASTDLPFTSMGVQFLGDSQIGWARVLFDGVEVWRGNTATIWSKHGRHGGYIEISGFEPGPHSIRAESLGFDFRPVTVAGFGFSYARGSSRITTVP